MRGGSGASGGVGIGTNGDDDDDDEENLSEGSDVEERIPKEEGKLICR